MNQHMGVMPCRLMRVKVGAQAHGVAVGRWPASAAAGVLAHGGCAQVRRQRRAGPAAGLAGGVAVTPRVVGRAVGRVRGAAHGQLAEVELAQQDGAGRLEAGDHRRILGWHVVRVGAGAVAGENALGVELVLDGHGNAEQGSANGGFVAATYGFVHVRGGSQGLFTAHGDVGLDVAVDGVDATEVGVDRVGGGEIPVADGGRGGLRRKERRYRRRHVERSWRNSGGLARLNDGVMFSDYGLERGRYLVPVKHVDAKR